MCPAKTLTKTLMLATSNPGKVIEFRVLLEQWELWRGSSLLTPKDWREDWPEPLPEVDETGASFAENARLKATTLARACGLPALADDSGLCVDALDGLPGLHSARWAGAGASDSDRNALLLSRLAGIAAEKRTGRYVCVVSLALPDGSSVEASGSCEGRIAEALQGDAGFGYDPLFFLPSLDRTMAELTTTEKNKISHRAAALRALSEDQSTCRLFLAAKRFPV